jgi:threonylcarbamoyladenosine tRNA methylthiotransferase MtaB
LCPHLHLPLQAGSDATLRRMARRTTRQTFAALVETARTRIPDVSITGDMIVGFPGETDAEFAESLAFAEEIGFARLHVFGYSKRPGTGAAKMPGHLPEKVIGERRAAMAALSERLWATFQAQYVGHTVDVLWESAHGATPEGFVWSGHTGNYLRVTTTSPQALNNTITTVRLAELTPRGLAAIPC